MSLFILFYTSKYLNLYEYQYLASYYSIAAISDHYRKVTVPFNRDSFFIEKLPAIKLVLCFTIPLQRENFMHKSSQNLFTSLAYFDNSL